MDQTEKNCGVWIDWLESPPEPSSARRARDLREVHSGEFSSGPPLLVPRFNKFLAKELSWFLLNPMAWFGEVQW